MSARALILAAALCALNVSATAENRMLCECAQWTRCVLAPSVALPPIPLPTPPAAQPRVSDFAPAKSSPVYIEKKPGAIFPTPPNIGENMNQRR